MAFDTTEDFCSGSLPVFYFQSDDGRPVTISGEALLSALSTHIKQNLIPAIESFNHALASGQLSTTTCEEEFPDLKMALTSSLDLLECIECALITGENMALKFCFEHSKIEKRQLEEYEEFSE